MKNIIVAMLAVMMMCSCAADKTVATVGNIKISRGEFEFYLSSIKSQMQGTELQTDEDWLTQEIEGEKAIEVAKRRAMDIAVKNAEYCEIARLADISVDENETSRLKTRKEKIISGFGGESGYKKYLNENNITDKFVDMMCDADVYYNKIKTTALEENPITRTEIENYYSSKKNVLENEYKKAKHILIMTQDGTTHEEFSAEKKENAKKRAEDIYEKVKSGADFDALMREFSEDPGLETNPDGYVFTSGEMVIEFEQAVDSVSYGEVAFCQSDFGYHIIKKECPNIDDFADKITEKLADERVENKISAWKKQYGLKIAQNYDVIKDIK